MTDWHVYQEEAATFFRSLGLDARTDVRIQGVRTAHDIDVLVKSQHVGFEVTWLVECKHWHTGVSKLHVLALREIVADAGADRGIILCEKGFQSGALEAARLTNVQATSLAALRQSATEEVLAMRMRELFDRTAQCRERYWAISKQERIDRGLRPDSPESGYSGQLVVECAEHVLAKALRAVYPMTCDDMYTHVVLGGVQTFTSPTEVVAAIGPLISELENLLDQ